MGTRFKTTTREVLMSKKLVSLEDLYLHELKDVYNAEKQITKALPKLAKAASSEELKSAFEEHLQQTEEQISRLEQIFERLGESTTGPKCKGMEGLVAEGDELSKEDAEDPVRDAGLIVSAQKVEHYEIAAYGSLCTFAEILGYKEDMELLKETLNEEEETDEKLTQIASQLNEEAQQAEGSSESEESEEESEQREPVGKKRATSSRR
jgi:ferritin-like metal-binding protein YciE